MDKKTRDAHKKYHEDLRDHRETVRQDWQVMFPNGLIPELEPSSSKTKTKAKQRQKF